MNPVLHGCLLLALASSALAQQPPAAGKEPKIERLVAEDDGVRIDELRVRGQTQRIVVQPKTGGARAYEIVPPVSGRDPSQAASRGAAGQRVWQVLDF